jgi:hypothetical protein
VLRKRNLQIWYIHMVSLSMEAVMVEAGALNIEIVHFFHTFQAFTKSPIFSDASNPTAVA